MDRTTITHNDIIMTGFSEHSSRPHRSLGNNRKQNQFNVQQTQPTFRLSKAGTSPQAVLEICCVRPLVPVLARKLTHVEQAPPPAVDLYVFTGQGSQAVAAAFIWKPAAHAEKVAEDKPIRYRPV